MTNPEHTLQTASLIIRPYEESDFEEFAALVADADVTRYLLWGPRDRAAAREVFEKRKLRWTPGGPTPHFQLALTELGSGAFVGEMALINLDNEHRGGEIGYILKAQFHRRGLAVEAGRVMLGLGFETIGLHRIQGTCDERNTGSARVMEKLGMRREAHHLSSHHYKGEWAGGYVYAMLEDEWRARKA